MMIENVECVQDNAMLFTPHVVNFINRQSGYKHVENKWFMY